MDMSKIVKVFDYLNYKDFVRDFLQALPKRGHGQFLKIAKALNIHTTIVRSEEHTSELQSH